MDENAKTNGGFTSSGKICEIKFGKRRVPTPCYNSQSPHSKVMKIKWFILY